MEQYFQVYRVKRLISNLNTPQRPIDYPYHHLPFRKHPTYSIIIDFLFVKEQPYLPIKYQVYQLHGPIFCRGRDKIETNSAIKQYINKCGVRGIAITYIHAYNKFEKVRELLSPIHLEINVRSKNIGDIAREVRTFKDQFHYITVSTPHKKMATFMIEANF